jgi:hypothetical protein
MNLSGKHHRIAQQECVGKNIYGSSKKGVKLVKRQKHASTAAKPREAKRSQMTAE